MHGLVRPHGSLRGTASRLTRPALALEGAWKRYLLGEGRGLFGALGRGERETLWALRDVTLAVQPGESVGLIGHNGAGKTTVLKLLAGISRPTRGSVTANGRVASLINLGAGFHRELTGRENVFLNGVILGLTRSEVARRYDEIAEFAELGAYMDTPVKQYSTGMYARLGFSVAAHVDADVLLVDEVLSVGDVAFQDRSIRRMLGFRDEGRGILFVSHNLSAVEMMCQRAVWLDHGVVRAAGPSAEVVRQYLDEVDQGLVAMASAVTGNSLDAREEVELLDLGTYRSDGSASTDFEFGEPLVVRLRCAVHAEQAKNVRAMITVRGDYGPLFSADSLVDGFEVGPWARGRHDVECVFRALPVLPGLYRVEASLARGDVSLADLPHAAGAFRVNTDLAHYGSTSPVGHTKSRGGFVAVPYEWRIDAGPLRATLAGLHLPGEGRERG